MTFAEIASLTERQKVEIYAHKRDKDGNIRFPQELSTPLPSTLEGDLLAVDRLMEFLVLTNPELAEPENRDRVTQSLKEKVRKKYEEKEKK